MPERALRKNWVWTLISGLFLAGALFHLWRVIDPVHADASPPWRHALFLGINCIAAWGTWRPSRWLFWPFGILVLQQLYSHGGDLWRVWHQERSVDWVSLLVVTGMPAIWVALWRARGRGFTSPQEHSATATAVDSHRSR